MIIDSSALLAIILEEPEMTTFSKIIHNDRKSKMSTASYLECALKCDHPDNNIDGDILDYSIKRLKIKLEPVTERQIHMARDVNMRYGRNARHKAKLNYGDCFAYALAKDLDMPLLFKGDDFVHTDVYKAA